MTLLQACGDYQLHSWCNHAGAYSFLEPEARVAQRLLQSAGTKVSTTTCCHYKQIVNTFLQLVKWFQLRFSNFHNDAYNLQLLCCNLIVDIKVFVARLQQSHDNTVIEKRLLQDCMITWQLVAATTSWWQCDCCNKAAVRFFS